MLTEKEIAWLSYKSKSDYPAPCFRWGVRGLLSMRYCLTSPCDYNRSDSPKFCPLASGYRDAAEFEARVAATIARGEFYRPCHSVDVEKCAYPVEGNCCVCHIKYARLAVEDEMEKEKNNEKQSA